MGFKKIESIIFTIFTVLIAILSIIAKYRELS